MQAVLEGVAMALADGHVALAATGARIDHIALTGGGARSALWARLIAAAIGRPLSLAADQHAGPAIGAARLSRVAIGGPLMAPPKDHDILPVVAVDARLARTAPSQEGPVLRACRAFTEGDPLGAGQVRLPEPSGARIRRRRFLAGSLAGATVAAPFTIARGAPIAFTSDPFALGVASGAPREDRRRAVDPPRTEAARRRRPCRTRRSRSTGRSRTTRTSPVWPRKAPCRHRLSSPIPCTWRSRACSRAGHTGIASAPAARLSPIGRTRTAPQAASSPARFRFAFASCQQYEQGYFAAYRDMAGRDLDLVVHLGDYIYEKSWGSRHVRRHGVGIPTTLPEFRDRYALYKLDPDLQAAHAAFPWLAIWDDHEVADDYADDRSYTTPDPVRFMKMRAAAYQAYYEHMPLPASARPRGPFATIYERYRFGDMLDVMLLDDRQYRSPPPASAAAVRPPCQTARSARSKRARCWAASRKHGSTGRSQRHGRAGPSWPSRR